MSQVTNYPQNAYPTLYYLVPVPFIPMLPPMAASGLLMPPCRELNPGSGAKVTKVAMKILCPDVVEGRAQFNRLHHPEAYAILDGIMHAQTTLCANKAGWPNVTYTIRDFLYFLFQKLQDEKQADPFPALPIRNATLVTTIDRLPYADGRAKEIDIRIRGQFDIEKIVEQYNWLYIVMGSYFYETLMSDPHLAPSEKERIRTYWDGGGNVRKRVSNHLYFYKLYMGHKEFGSRFLFSSTNVEKFYLSNFHFTAINRGGEMYNSYLKTEIDISAYIADPMAPLLFIGEDKDLDVTFCVGATKFELPPDCREVAPYLLFDLALLMTKQVTEICEESKRIALDALIKHDIQEVLERYCQTNRLSMTKKRSVLFFYHLLSLLPRECVEQKEWILITIQKYIFGEQRYTSAEIETVLELWVFSRLYFLVQGLQENMVVTSFICCKDSDGNVRFWPAQDSVRRALQTVIAVITLEEEEKQKICEGLKFLHYFMNGEMTRPYYPLWDKRVLIDGLDFVRLFGQLVAHPEEYRPELIEFFSALERVELGDLSPFALETAVIFENLIPLPMSVITNFWQKIARKGNFLIRIEAVYLAMRRGEDISEWLQSILEDTPTAFESEVALCKLLTLPVNQEKARNYLELYGFLRESFGQEVFHSHIGPYRRFLMQIVNDHSSLIYVINHVLHDLPAFFYLKKSSLHTMLRHLFVHVDQAIAQRIVSSIHFPKLAQFLMNVDDEEMLVHFTFNAIEIGRLYAKTVRGYGIVWLHLLENNMMKMQEKSALLFVQKFAQLCENKLPLVPTCEFIRTYCRVQGCSPCSCDGFLDFLSHYKKEEVCNEILHFGDAALSLWFLEQGPFTEEIRNKIWSQWWSLGLCASHAFKYWTLYNTKGDEHDLFIILGEKGGDTAERAIRGWASWFQSRVEEGLESINDSAPRMLSTISAKMNSHRKSKAVVSFQEQLGTHLKKHMGHNQKMKIYITKLLMQVNEELYERIQVSVKNKSHLSLLQERIKIIFYNYVTFFCIHDDTYKAYEAVLPSLSILSHWRKIISFLFDHKELLEKPGLLQEMITQSYKFANQHFVVAEKEHAKAEWFSYLFTCSKEARLEALSLYTTLEQMIFLSLEQQDHFTLSLLRGMVAFMQEAWHDGKAVYLAMEQYITRVITQLCFWMERESCTTEKLVRKYPQHFTELASLGKLLIEKELLVDCYIDTILIPLTKRCSFNPRQAVHTQWFVDKLCMANTKELVENAHFLELRRFYSATFSHLIPTKQNHNKLDLELMQVLLHWVKNPLIAAPNSIHATAGILRMAFLMKKNVFEAKDELQNALMSVIYINKLSRDTFPHPPNAIDLLNFTGLLLICGYRKERMLGELLVSLFLTRLPKPYYPQIMQNILEENNLKRKTALFFKWAQSLDYIDRTSHDIIILLASYSGLQEQATRVGMHHIRGDYIVIRNLLSTWMQGKSIRGSIEKPYTEHMFAIFQEKLQTELPIAELEQTLENYTALIEQYCLICTDQRSAIENCKLLPYIIERFLALVAEKKMDWAKVSPKITLILKKMNEGAFLRMKISNDDLFGLLTLFCRSLMRGISAIQQQSMRDIFYSLIYWVGRIMHYLHLFQKYNPMADKKRIAAFQEDIIKETVECVGSYYADPKQRKIELSSLQQKLDEKYTKYREAFTGAVWNWIEVDGGTVVTIQKKLVSYLR